MDRHINISSDENSINNSHISQESSYNPDRSVNSPDSINWPTNDQISNLFYPSDLAANEEVSSVLSSEFSSDNSVESSINNSHISQEISYNPDRSVNSPDSINWPTLEQITNLFYLSDLPANEEVSSVHSSVFSTDDSVGSSNFTSTENDQSQNSPHSEINDDSIPIINNNNSPTPMDGINSSPDNTQNYSATESIPNNDIIEISQNEDNTVLINNDEEASYADHRERDNILPNSLSTNNGVIVVAGSQDDFTKLNPCKKARCTSPVDKSFYSKKSSEESEENLCSICMDAWTNSGLHRLVSLKCGHLFGQSCIEKWLTKQNKCPQCNGKSFRKHIRVIFAKNTLKVVDTYERDRLMEEVEKLKNNNRKLQMDCQLYLMQRDHASEKADKFKQELENIKRTTQHLTNSSFKKFYEKDLFKLEHVIRISETGQCRVMTYNETMHAMYISQPSISTLFQGFGVRMIYCADMKPVQYIPLHSKQIRDLSMNDRRGNNLLLSCSIDKTVKLTSLTSNQNVHIYKCNSPAWCCTWNTDDSNIFYVGLQSGHVSSYDVRNLNSSICELSVAGDSYGFKSPTVSLQYSPKQVGKTYRPNGLLAGFMDKGVFFEQENSNNYKIHLLPTEGNNLTYMALHQATSHVLVSYRPGTIHKTMRHELYELSMQRNNLDTVQDIVDQIFTLKKVDTFLGGPFQKMLTRNCLFTKPFSENLFVCAGDDHTERIQLWDANKGLEQQKLLTNCGSVVDISYVKYSFQNVTIPYLMALGDKDLCVYKWTP